MNRKEIKEIFDIHLKSLGWDKSDPIQKAMYLRLIDAAEFIVEKHHTSIHKIKPLPYNRSKEISNCLDCSVLPSLCALHDK